MPIKTNIVPFKHKWKWFFDNDKHRNNYTCIFYKQLCEYISWLGDSSIKYRFNFKPTDFLYHILKMKNTFLYSKEKVIL